MAEIEGVLAGPAAWSPDGRLLATTTVRSLTAPAGIPTPTTPTGFAFVDATGLGADAPTPLELPLSPQGHVLGWSGSDQILTLLEVPGTDPCCGPEAYDLSDVPLDGRQHRTLMQIADLPGFGVSRFQLAAATIDGLRTVVPDAVDRGQLPLPLRGGLALLIGLVAWGATRAASRSTRTR